MKMLSGNTEVKNAVNASAQDAQYDDIKRVLSIWICMNMKQNSMNYFHLTNDRLVGSCEWEGKIEKLPGYAEEYELHRLLGTLLSKQFSTDEKLSIIETEYHIPIEGKIRKDVSVMCNLSQGIRDEATDNAITGVIMTMYSNNFTLKQIVLATSKSVEEVKTIIGKGEPVLV
ncbi:hypothetical protein AALB47_06710 [Lachnospiraceae bacterium 54-11]